jgi:hypothetical protein
MQALSKYACAGDIDVSISTDNCGVQAAGKVVLHEQSARAQARPYTVDLRWGHPTLSARHRAAGAGNERFLRSSNEEIAKCRHSHLNCLPIRSLFAQARHELRIG